MLPLSLVTPFTLKEIPIIYPKWDWLRRNQMIDFGIKVGVMTLIITCPLCSYSPSSSSCDLLKTKTAHVSLLLNTLQQLLLPWEQNPYFFFFLWPWPTKAYQSLIHLHSLSWHSGFQPPWPSVSSSDTLRVFAFDPWYLCDKMSPPYRIISWPLVGKYPSCINVHVILIISWTTLFVCLCYLTPPIPSPCPVSLNKSIMWAGTLSDFLSTISTATRPGTAWYL